MRIIKNIKQKRQKKMNDLYWKGELLRLGSHISFIQKDITEEIQKG